MAATQTPISREEVEKIKDLFALYDRDGDGFLGEDDMKYVMKSMYNYEPTPDEVRGAIASMVPHHESYKVDFKSFLWYKIHDQNIRKRNASSAEMREAFRFLDQDGDGYLGFEDMVRLFDLIDVRRTRAQVEETMDEADADNDGKISFDDFCKTMTTFIPKKLLRERNLKGLSSRPSLV